jgi:hypothetical protein
MLRKPDFFEKLLGIVKNVLFATAVVRGEIAPPSNWQSQSTAVGSWF